MNDLIPNQIKPLPQLRLLELEAGEVAVGAVNDGRELKEERSENAQF